MSSDSTSSHRDTYSRTLHLEAVYVNVRARVMSRGRLARAKNIFSSSICLGDHSSAEGYLAAAIRETRCRKARRPTGVSQLAGQCMHWAFVYKDLLYWEGTAADQPEGVHV